MTLSTRKVGGIRWFSFGRVRIAFCICRKPKRPDPLRLAYNRELRAANRERATALLDRHYGAES